MISIRPCCYHITSNGGKPYHSRKQTVISHEWQRDFIQCRAISISTKYDTYKFTVMLKMWIFNASFIFCQFLFLMKTQLFHFDVVNLHKLRATRDSYMSYLLPSDTNVVIFPHVRKLVSNIRLTVQCTCGLSADAFLMYVCIQMERLWA